MESKCIQIIKQDCVQTITPVSHAYENSVEDALKNLEQDPEMVKGFWDAVESIAKGIDELIMSIAQKVADQLGISVENTTPEQAVKLWMNFQCNNWRKMHGMPMKRRRRKHG